MSDGEVRTPTHPRRRWARAWGAALAATAVAPSSLGDIVQVRAPMVCSRGPRRQTFSAVVSMPRSRPPGSTFVVRIDSMPSGRLSHFGLYAIYNMTTDYALSPGLRYVEGSLHLVAGTGTANVVATARAWHDAAGVHLVLPARVNNGSSYTPPSLQFELTVDAPVGRALAVRFSHYHVDASVFLLGDIRTTCTPDPPTATIGALQVSTP